MHYGGRRHFLFCLHEHRTFTQGENWKLVPPYTARAVRTQQSAIYSGMYGEIAENAEYMRATKYRMSTAWDYDNIRITKYMMPVTISTAMVMTTAG